MNHIKTTSVITAIVAAAIALAAVTMAMPQQALAYGHHHNHHDNSIKVSQDISQLNACSNSICVNTGSNSVDIDR